MSPAIAAEGRRGFMGGSDVAAALGISPWKTPFRLWQEKTGKLQGQDDEARNEALHLEWGRMMEDDLLAAYTRITGRAVRARKERLVHPAHPWITGELDALTEDGTRVVEAKNAAYHRAWGDPEAGEVPTYYAAQGLHYLALVPSAGWCDFPASRGGRWPDIYPVERDDRLIANLIEFECEWWDRHVLKDEPPDPITLEDAAARWTPIKGKVVHATKDTWALVHDLARAKAQVKLWEKAEEALALEVRKAIADGTELVDPETAALLATWHQQPTTNFDLERFRKEHPEMALAYDVSSKVRVLRIKVKADPEEPR